MREHQLSAYLVPMVDAHLNEYVPACWRRLAWLSGFTGSAGDLLILPRQAILWTDGRYFLQAEQELEGSGIELFRKDEPGVLDVEPYLRSIMKKDAKVGVDPRVLSIASAKLLRKNLESVGASLVYTERNLVDTLWTDAPEMPTAPIEVLSREQSGASTRTKLEALRTSMKQENADALVITTLDAIAWTFNVRGNDVLYNPVVIAYAIVTEDDAKLFLDLAKVGKEQQRRLSRDVTLCSYDSVRTELSALAKRKARVWVDEHTTNQWVTKNLGRCDLVTTKSPILERKAKKNTVEIEGIRRAHVRDGVAMVRFLRWLSVEAPKGHVTELSAESRLEELRSVGEHYRGPSFRTISAFGPHGAITHYAATEQSNVKLGSGVFLIDTGSQYTDGTTDITRTILIGAKATDQQRRLFTLVLKGHIALAQTRFPQGVRGMRLDTIARTHLWSDGLDYGHGTGHGVGAFLSVHEGPQAISPVRCKGAFIEAGNVVSIEPGCYIAGKFGIRIENLNVVVKDDKRTTKAKTWLGFETLTLCPIDRSLIDDSLLTPSERQWLNDYHQHVENTLGPLVDDPQDRDWLTKACVPV